MADVAVWDERDDYTACTWRSTLMVIVASGFTAFPLGAYTVEEARAFRDGDARLNFSGPVEHALSRYGITVQSPAPYSQTGLREALSTPGRAYAVAGRTANFPAGHSIRRWDPVFAGFHAVCVIPLGGGLCRWLDPLAYTGFAGDTVSVADVVDTFAAGNYPNDARYLPLEDDMRLAGVKATGPGIGTFTFGPVAHALISPIDLEDQYLRAPGAGPYNVIAAVDLKTPTGMPMDIGGNTPPLNNRDQVYLVDDPQFGVAAYALRQDGVFTPAPVGFTQAEVDAKITAAIAALPAPVAPAPSTPALPAGVDIPGALAAINAIPTQTNRIATARTEIVRLKNLAKTKLGG